MSLFLFLGLLGVSCLYALARGGPPERIAAGLYLGAFAVDELVHRMIDGSSYASVELGSLALDTVLFLALTVLAWRSTRHWTQWVAAWQLAAVVAHLAKLIDPTMEATGYAFQAQVWAYPIVATTAIGAWRYRERWNAGIREPDWKSALT
ncbi:hypothetical protein AV944_00530 [Sphingomonas sp. LK11]|uniref:hypothetical protein n=1 Tax=Sphingomonas sp. LK11 TaxID=1390395 RepID=UPI0009728718|nr:hypothetical protein [Sphingomonas sp. LK11]APX64584.1 hypothetical protein AV944_00530 [Sphingomonas sp. LK11]